MGSELHTTRSTTTAFSSTVSPEKSTSHETFSTESGSKPETSTGRTETITPTFAKESTTPVFLTSSSTSKTASSPTAEVVTESTTEEEHTKSTTPIDKNISSISSSETVGPNQSTTEREGTTQSYADITILSTPAAGLGTTVINKEQNIKPCKDSGDCSNIEVCIAKQCLNVCAIGGSCASNAKCTAVNHTAVCSCPPHHYGDPQRICYKGILLLICPRTPKKKQDYYVNASVYFLYIIT